jgi:hypothetical protein
MKDKIFEYQPEPIAQQETEDTNQNDPNLIVKESCEKDNTQSPKFPE